MSPAIWLDGDLIDESAAQVSAFDHGITVGDGIFETLQVVDGTAFALRRHLARLRRSAEGMRFAVPHSDDALREAVGRVLTANPDAGRIRITVTGGKGPLGSPRSDGPATVIIAASAGRDWARTESVATVPWRRNEHGAVTGLKTTSYAENVVALDYAHERGAGEAVFANTAGNLCEGTGTNVFLGLGGNLVTPPLSSGCLAGITRELLLELVPVVERDVPLEALAAADEAFLASSTRDVQPIEAVDGTALPACPGPLTEQAGAAFAELLATNLDP